MKNSQRPRPKAEAFSLLELLLMIALIALLSALLYGSSSRSTQTRRIAGCQKNLQTIYVALQIYADEFDGQFPRRSGAGSSEEPLSLLIPKYTSVTESFICPGSLDQRLPEAEPFAQRKISYAYYMGRRATNQGEVLMTDRQISTEMKTRGAPVFSANGQAPGNNHHKYGGNLMFCDGRIQQIPPHGPFAIPLPPGIALLNPRP